MSSLVAVLRDTLKEGKPSTKLDSALEGAGVEIFTNDPREYVEALRELLNMHDFEPSEKKIIARAVQQFQKPPTLRLEASKLRKLTR